MGGVCRVRDVSQAFDFCLTHGVHYPETTPTVISLSALHTFTCGFARPARRRCLTPSVRSSHLVERFPVEVDPTNPIAQLCVQGMQAEVEGRGEDALALFSKAWEERSDDYEACIAAHYLGAHQQSAIDALHWNQVAIDRANVSDEGRVAVLYPKLYLNLGRTFEEMGDLDQADASYFLAQERLRALPDHIDGSVLQSIQNGMQRVERKLADALLRQALAG